MIQSPSREVLIPLALITSACVADNRDLSPSFPNTISTVDSAINGSFPADLPYFSTSKYSAISCRLIDVAISNLGLVESFAQMNIVDLRTMNIVSVYQTELFLKNVFRDLQSGDVSKARLVVALDITDKVFTASHRIYSRLKADAKIDALHGSRRVNRDERLDNYVSHLRTLEQLEMLHGVLREVTAQIESAAEKSHDSSSRAENPQK